MSKTEVSGGTIWTPKQDKSYVPVPKTLEELKQERYEDLIDNKIPLAALIISIILYAGMLTFNVMASYAEAPTDEYFPLAKVPFLTPGTGGWVFSLILIIFSVLLLGISFLLYSRTEDDTAFSIIMIVLLFLMATGATSGLVVQTAGTKVDNWLQETHGLTIETGNLPYEDGIIDKQFTAVDKEGNEVNLTLEIKDLNLYILKQEIVKKN